MIKNTCLFLMVPEPSVKFLWKSFVQSIEYSNVTAKYDSHQQDDCNDSNADVQIQWKGVNLKPKCILFCKTSHCNGISNFDVWFWLIEYETKVTNMFVNIFCFLETPWIVRGKQIIRWYFVFSDGVIDVRNGVPNVFDRFGDDNQSSFGLNTKI